MLQLQATFGIHIQKFQLKPFAVDCHGGHSSSPLNAREGGKLPNDNGDFKTSLFTSLKLRKTMIPSWDFYIEVSDLSGLEYKLDGLW